MPVGTAVQIALIVGVTALATLSVVTGLDKGIRILSELNLGLAVLLLALVLVLVALFGLVRWLSARQGGPA